MMKITPEELWQNAKHGDQSAWQQLYQLFSGPIYQFFLKNTRNVEMAADKTQEVFLRVFRSRDGFSGGSLKSWFFRIARNLLIDEWRRSARREILSDKLPEIADQAPGVEEKVIAAINQELMKTLIDECLDLLDDDNRMIICLVYLAGLSVPELAESMEIPLGTAKTRVRQARLRLDAMLCEKMQLRGIEQPL